MNNKPSIISYVSRTDACFWYRNKMPLDALKRAGYETTTINGGTLMDLEKVDIVQFSRIYTTDFESFLYMLKKKGIKIWYDIDDAVDLVTDFNPYGPLNRKHMSAFYFLLNEADFITTTNENLRQHLQQKTPKPISVFPNFINPKDWKKRPQASTNLRVGFAGSPSHIKEVNMILPVIRELQKHYDFTFVILGMGNGDSVHDWYADSKKNYESVWGTWEYTIEVEKMYGLMKEIKHEWHKAVRWELYPKKLPSLDLDIGLCPLLEDAFNVCKSAIKLYEYALVGTTALASNVTPFKEEALALTENDYDSWYAALDALLMHSDLREKTHEKQLEYVLKNKVIDDNITSLEVILAPYERKR